MAAKKNKKKLVDDDLEPEDYVRLANGNHTDSEAEGEGSEKEEEEQFQKKEEEKKKKEEDSDEDEAPIMIRGKFPSVSSAPARFPSPALVLSLLALVLR